MCSSFVLPVLALKLLLGNYPTDLCLLSMVGSPRTTEGADMPLAYLAKAKETAAWALWHSFQEYNLQITPLCKMLDVDAKISF